MPLSLQAKRGNPVPLSLRAKRGNPVEKINFFMRLPRHFVPRNDTWLRLPRHFVPRNDTWLRLSRHFVPRNDTWLRLPRHFVPRNDTWLRLPRHFVPRNHNEDVPQGDTLFLFRCGQKLFDNGHTMLNKHSKTPGGNIGILFAY